MPFSTPIHAETTQNNGLAGVAALNGSGGGHVGSADKITIKTLKGLTPYLLGGGGTSVSKPNGAALLFDQLYGGNKCFMGAGRFFPAAWDRFMRYAPIELMPGDKITAQLSNTNVNEASIVAYDISYAKSRPRAMDPARMLSRYKEIIKDMISITVANAITYNDAAADMATLMSGGIGKTVFLNEKYDIVGFFPIVTTAVGGVVTISGSIDGAEWNGQAPGAPISPLGAVTLYGDPYQYLLPEPIPIDFNSPPTLGMCGLSAAAETFGIMLGKK